MKKLQQHIPTLNSEWKWSWDESQHNPDQGILTPRFLETFLSFQDTPDQHEKTGSVYTPPIITHAMVSYVLDAWIQENPSLPLETLKIIEPCAGSGAFILALFDEVKNKNNPMESGISPPSLCQTLIKFFQSNIHIFDLNENALQIAQIRLQARFMTHFPNISLRELKDVHLNYTVGNALDFPWTVNNEAPHIIIGNPPYVSADSMRKYFSVNQISNLKAKYRHVIKNGSKPDLFFYFLAHGCQQLREKGRLTFIIPNRILSNDYAQTIRQFILTSAPPEYIVDFSPTVDVFGNANVHPCILILNKSKLQPLLEEARFAGYNSLYLSELNLSQEFTISKMPAIKIEPLLIEQYNVFFTSINQIQHQLLRLAGNFPRLFQICNIHEATRLARFQDKYPPHTTIRISADQWNNLPADAQLKYLHEVRGEDIMELRLKPPRQYLTLPKLIQASSPAQLHEFLIPYQDKTLYLRELGRKIFIALNRGLYPNLGYGGVYYIQESDLQPTTTLSLWGLLAYFASQIPLLLYRTLFAAGSWGDALKFRSSYLSQLPFISVNPLSLNHLGLLLDYFAEKNDRNHVELIIQQIDLLLIGKMILNQPNSSITQKELELIEQIFVLPSNLHSLILQTNPNIQQSSFIDQFLKELQINPHFLSISQKILSDPFTKDLFRLSN